MNHLFNLRFMVALQVKVVKAAEKDEAEKGAEVVEGALDSAALKKMRVVEEMG